MKATAVALLGALAVGCAGKLPPCPSQGGPPWRELESPHFRLRTDADPGEARAMLDELELFQAAVLAILDAPPDLRTGQLPVVLLRDGWFTVADGRTEAIFRHALFQPLVVKRAGGDLMRQVAVRYGLYYHLVSLVMPACPLWLTEGMATYLQTMAYDADRGQLTIGRPPADLVAIIERASFLHVEDMLSGNGWSVSAAWITVQYLMTRRRAELVAYQKELAARTPAPEAWTRAFGALTPAALDMEIRGYVNGRQYGMLTLPFSRPRFHVVERALSDADAHATRALLVLAGRANRLANPAFVGGSEEFTARARGELDELFREEPAHVMGRALAHFGLDEPVDLAQAEQMTRDHPGDWMGWLLYAEALRAQGAEGASVATRTAVQIARVDASVVIPVDEKTGLLDLVRGRE